MPLEMHSLPSGVAATTLLCNLYDYEVDTTMLVHDLCQHHINRSSTEQYLFLE
ncbi:hypothetical protein APHCRT_1054 [Anaplasma phagocytophilum str. CRT53-1]|uniref:Uncharacterized protein n=1 Tax=Anaplasma phagocytophilum str. CRT53-1 TaxID=1359157 RepID=A0A0F3PUC0_ANAPH|nr:hypothetical protein APHCRT_1063 [Anaplasma phagocytophilum str. CRT53-1]KJV83960.1 hypothetical protein APHCRT_1054 [Anaplasma phagocytophilum str. CRT53-1]